MDRRQPLPTITNGAEPTLNTTKGRKLRKFGRKSDKLQPSCSSTETSELAKMPVSPASPSRTDADTNSAMRLLSYSLSLMEDPDAERCTSRDEPCPYCGDQFLRFGVDDQSASQLPLAGMGQIHVTELPSPYTTPEEALLFEPSETDICDQSTRYIFLNTLYSPSELAGILRVLHELDELECENNDLVTSVAPVILRFFYSAKFDCKETARILKKHVKFRLRCLPICDMDMDIRAALSSSAIYWHGRDCRLRPLLVVRLDRLQPLEGDTRLLIRLLIFSLEYFLRFLQVAGRVECWNILIDCEGRGVTNVPLDPVKSLMRVLNCVYRSRLATLYVINYSWWLGMISNLVVSLMPASATSKLCMMASDWQVPLRESFAKHQLEEKYGGSAPNVESGEGYPYRFYPGPFEVDSEPNPDAMEALHEMLPAEVIAGYACNTGTEDDYQMLAETQFLTVRTANDIGASPSTFLDYVAFE